MAHRYHVHLLYKWDYPLNQMLTSESNVCQTCSINKARLSSNFPLITKVRIQEWIVHVLGGKDKQTNSAHEAFKEAFHPPS